MKWTYSFQNKISAAAILFCLFAALLFSTLREQNTTEEVIEAVSAMYNDRLIVQGFIHQYTSIAQHIETSVETEALSGKAKERRIQQELDKAKLIHVTYLNTRLTEREEEVFHSLKKHFESIEVDGKGHDFKKVRKTLSHVYGELDSLAMIQLEEAKRQMNSIRKLSNTSAILFRFDVAVLITIAIIIQALLFSAKTLRKATKTPPSLN